MKNKFYKTISLKLSLGGMINSAYFILYLKQERSIKMQFREDKKTGNQISILGFGCMRLPTVRGQIDIDKTEKLFLEAINNGINYFDTAYFYIGSEAAIGQIFEKNNLREKVYLATKLPLMLCKNTSDFDKYFNIQLKRLRTDYIDYYFMHMLSGPEQWEALCKLGIIEWIAENKKNGKIKQVGFSFHGKRDNFIKLVDEYNWDFCQIQYNYININYQAGNSGLKYAVEKGLPVFIMEPLLGGRLANSLPQQALDIMGKADKSMTPVAWALKWIWNHSEVTMLLSGMNELEQLRENISLADTSVPNMWTEKELTTINKVIEIFNASYKISCTGCNYCMPCPKGIDIPGCFASYNASYSMKLSTGMLQYMLNTGATTRTPALASMCVKCGKCEKHCPQNIPIRDSLQKVKKRLEPFWFKPVISLVRNFVK